ncbi:MAG: glycosyl hydrolase family 18 protein [Thermoanaerobaculia bacterium]
MNRRIAVVISLLVLSLSVHADYRLSVWVRNKTVSYTNFNTYNPYNGSSTVHEVNPVWVYFTTTTVNGQTVVDLVDVHTVTFTAPTGAVLVPTIQNTVQNGGFQDSSTLMGYIFRSEADMDDHANKVANLVRTKGWDGIDLDYERMLVNVTDADIPAWRDKFTSLVRKIKSRLPDKTLSVTVYRRRSASGSTDSRNAKIYDYRGLTNAGAADFMKIMMYNDIGSYSELVNDGAMETALNYAESEVWDHKKIIVALPWYSYNFTAGAEGPSVPEASGLGRNGSWEQTFTSPHSGVQIDAEALRHKILIVIRKHDVGGFAAWETGAALSGVWDVLRGRIGTEGASVTAQTPADCSGTVYANNPTWPVGASDTMYNWFKTADPTGCSPLAKWIDDGNPGTGLTSATHAVRISGVVDGRVFEAQSNPIAGKAAGCP